MNAFPGALFNVSASVPMRSLSPSPHSEDANQVHVRPANPDDAFIAALLLNATQQPHFQHTAARLTTTFADPEHTYELADQGGRPIGLASCSFPKFHPPHAWIGLHLHPDHLHDGTHEALLQRRTARALKTGRRRLWTSVREDYPPAGPPLEALGFGEMYRTFGGGFHLVGYRRLVHAGTA